jgi:GNAT superfamily N-acetyltransferase
LNLRPGTTDDLPKTARLVLDGFESYREWAPSDWQPPSWDTETERSAERLRTPGTWVRIAETDAGADVVGLVSLYPDDEVPGGGYLWQFFVARSHWGTGLAARLHAEAIDEAHARAWSNLRLRTPEGAARARAFYRREGWIEDPEPVDDPRFGLPLRVLRRAL